MFNCKHKWELFKVTYQEGYTTQYDGKPYHHGDDTTYVIRCHKCGDLNTRVAGGKEIYSAV